MSGRLVQRRPAIAGTALVAGLVAGCGGGGGSSPAGSAAASLPSGGGVTAAVSATPSPSPSASPSTAGTETDLTDGRHPVRIIAVDTTGRKVQVDVIQFFSGEAAAKAAAEDHAPEVPPPNDVWIRNASTRLRVLPIAPGAVVTVNTLAGSQTGDATKDVPWTLAQLAGSDRLSGAVFWLTLDGGQVTRIAEQYLP